MDRETDHEAAAAVAQMAGGNGHGHFRRRVLPIVLAVLTICASVVLALALGHGLGQANDAKEIALVVRQEHDHTLARERRFVLKSCQAQNASNRSSLQYLGKLAAQQEAKLPPAKRKARHKEDQTALAEYAFLFGRLQPVRDCQKVVRDFIGG